MRFTAGIWMTEENGKLRIVCAKCGMVHAANGSEAGVLQCAECNAQMLVNRRM